MLLQTNSYIVPREKRMEHARLLRRFRQVLLRLGCDHFEVYEQVGANWSTNETSGRFVQIMHFRDRKHQLAIQAAERSDPTAQSLLKEFCELINLPYQQQQGLFAVGFYTSFLRMPQRTDVPGVTGQAAPESTSQSEAVSHVEGSPSTPDATEPPQGGPGAAEESAVTTEPSGVEVNPEPDAPELPESAPMSGIAEESAGTTEPSGLDVNSDPDAPELPESAPMSGIAEESAGTTEPSGLDVNSEPDTEAANDSDPLDSQSVFLPAADDDELVDPGNPGEPAPPEDEDAGAENPTSPFSS